MSRPSEKGDEACCFRVCVCVCVLLFLWGGGRELVLFVGVFSSEFLSFLLYLFLSFFFLGRGEFALWGERENCYFCFGGGIGGGRLVFFFGGLVLRCLFVALFLLVQFACFPDYCIQFVH